MGNRHDIPRDPVEDMPPPEEESSDGNTPIFDPGPEDATSAEEDSWDESDQDWNLGAEEDHDRFQMLLEVSGNLPEDASEKLVFLSELYNSLLHCDERSISSETAGTLSSSLVRVLKEEMIPDIALLAVRAMIYLCDSPRWSGFLVRDDAVSALCQKLMAIEDMDVAEQCLQALEKISLEQPLACLQGGAIMAVLNYLDFFSRSTQRVALSTVMNICRKLPSGLTSPFMEAVPILCSLLLYDDAKVVEMAAGCLLKISNRVCGSLALLEELCDQGIIHPIIDHLSSSNRTALPQTMHNSLLGLLANLTSGSFSAFKALYELNISSVLKGVFSTLDVSHKGFSSHMIDNQSNKIHGALNLLDQLIPSSMGDLNISESSEKETYLCNNPELLQNLVRNNLPSLIQVSNSGSTTYICYAGLSIIKKLIHWCEPDTLVDSLRTANISSFLAGVLRRKEQHVLLIALQTSELILQKLPGVFSRSFVKEGVFFSIEALLKLPRVTPEACSQSEAPEKKASGGVSRCLCHSFGPKRNSCNIGKDYPVHNLAKRIRSAHFPAESGETSSLVLRDLTALSKALKDMVLTFGQDDDDNDQYYGILQKIIEKLDGEKEKEESISTFEFLESGIVESLSFFLMTGRSPSCFWDAGKRLEVFARLLLQSQDSPSLTNLVRKLQKALSALETIPLFLNSASEMKENLGYQSEGSTARLPRLRVRFVRAEGETSLRDYYKDSYVGMNPLSTVKAVEERLWPKVRAESQKNIEEEGHASDSLPKLLFFLGGKQLNQHWSLYQAILETGMTEEEESSTASQRSWWARGHTLTYKRAEDGDEIRPEKQLSRVVKKQPTLAIDILFLISKLESVSQMSPFVETHDKIRAFAEGKLFDLDAMRLEEAAEPLAALSEFVNSKLTEKLEQQMRDPMAVGPEGIPLWCEGLLGLAPILLGFESKIKYFRLATSTHCYIENRTHYSLVPSRQKFSVCRTGILSSAAWIMEKLAGQKVSLVVEYEGEVGTGLGPTLEFYTLVSHEFQRTGMQMWRGDHDSAEFVTSPFGLFPRPWSSSRETLQSLAFKEVLEKFRLLGQIVAKALQDGRVLDIRLSKAFYKLMLHRELCLYDLVSIDPGFARTLLEFKALTDRKLYLEKSRKQEVSAREYDSWFRGTRIEDLCLDFTLPGYPEFVLSSEFEHKTVTMSNLEEYVLLVLEATLNSGIYKQVEAFRSGFNQVFPIRDLRIFNENELEHVLCAEQVSWDVSDLVDNVKIEHGYTSDSTPIIHLLEIIRDFDANEQRAFLQFVTGAPRLPLGGFKSLSPNLTIVRKVCEVGLGDSELPSVMTCANYLKLPPYSTKETMRDKILYAITEGQGSFHLS